MVFESVPRATYGGQACLRVETVQVLYWPHGQTRGGEEEEVGPAPWSGGRGAGLDRGRRGEERPTGGGLARSYREAVNLDNSDLNCDFLAI